MLIDWELLPEEVGLVVTLDVVNIGGMTGVITEAVTEDTLRGVTEGVTEGTNKLLVVEALGVDGRPVAEVDTDEGETRLLEEEVVLSEVYTALVADLVAALEVSTDET